MAGHSHWAGIKHKKAANDAKKGKAFSKMALLIHGAVREGGSPDPDMNPRLRLILDKAKAINMPKDKVQRAIDKAAGASGEAFEQVVYEGYGPGGAAFLVQALTDNRNRTFPEVRRIFEQHGGSLGQPGCVGYLFDRKGLITVSAAAADEDAVLEAALDRGAEDMTTEDDLLQIVTPPDRLFDVRDALQAREIPVEGAELAMLPSTTMPVQGADAERALRLAEALDEHEDVENVFTNFDIPEEVAARLAGA